MTPVRVLLVDDAPDTRGNLRSFLEEFSSVPLEFVGEAGDGAGALRKAGIARPDVVVMDVRMEGMDGASATTHFHEQFPEVHVVLISMYEDDDTMERVRRVQPHAFVSKYALDELVGILGALGSGDC